MKSVVTTLGTEPSWVSSGGNGRGDTVPAYDRKYRQKQMYIYSISKRYNDKTKMQPCLIIVLILNRLLPIGRQINKQEQ